MVVWSGKPVSTIEAQQISCLAFVCQAVMWDLLQELPCTHCFAVDALLHGNYTVANIKSVARWTGPPRAKQHPKIFSALLRLRLKSVGWWYQMKSWTIWKLCDGWSEALGSRALLHDQAKKSTDTSKVFVAKTLPPPPSFQFRHTPHARTKVCWEAQ